MPIKPAMGLLLPEKTGYNRHFGIMMIGFKQG